PLPLVTARVPDGAVRMNSNPPMTASTRAMATMLATLLRDARFASTGGAANSPLTASGVFQHSYHVGSGPGPIGGIFFQAPHDQAVTRRRRADAPWSQDLQVCPRTGCASVLFGW